MREREFDRYVSGYDRMLERSLAITGESRDYFARRRIHRTARRIAEVGLQPRTILDFGCGDGTSSPMLAGQFGADHVLGIDVSAESIGIARQSRKERGLTFMVADEWIPDGSFDLAYCNGVFHHIPQSEREGCLRSIAQGLKPSGMFALWENNAWNPGTRYVMSQCEFDRDAITISPPEMRRVLRRAGFEVLRQEFIFYFPHSVRFLRPLEGWMSSIPLGGQYMTLCVK